jgi:hypothetical protein
MYHYDEERIASSSSALFRFLFPLQLATRYVNGIRFITIAAAAAWAIHVKLGGGGHTHVKSCHFAFINLS